MSILSFEKPAKARDSKTHAEKYSSSANIAGTYVPNMSKADMQKWKAKHIRGKDERVEIRKSINGVQLVVIVYKNRRDGDWNAGISHHENVQISANGKIQLSFAGWQEMMQAVEEAKAVLFPGSKSQTASKESFTAFLYEEDGEHTEGLATFDDAAEVIEYAKSCGWDEVVNDNTGEVVWRR